MRLRWVILIALAIVVLLMVADYVHAQTIPATRIRFAPTTNATPPSGFFNFYIDQATGLLVCRNDVGGSCLPAGGGGGSGTVTSFSAGNLSPLFTSSVATATTTPALTFALSNAAANTVFGNNTGSTAAPAFVSITAAMVPTLNQSTTGNAATATALAADGTNCSGGQAAAGVDASGNAEGCFAPGGGSGITSLGGLSGASQTFVNDTNVTVVSSGTTHTLTWAGALAKTRQHAATAYTDAGNTFTGSDTFKIANQIYYTSGYASIQAAIDALVAANSRGGTVVDDRIGSATIAGFTIKPGVTVILGAANYGFTSPIIMQPEGCHLIGKGSGNNGGTLIHQSGAIGDLIQSFDTSGGVYWHDCTIENLRIDMSFGGANAGADGIRIWNFGQSSVIRNVEVYNAPVNGITLDGNPVPVELENVSLYTNGAYGVDVDFNDNGDSAGNSFSFVNVGGDNNALSLFRFKNGNDRSTVNLFNLKSERRTNCTVQNPVILSDDFSGTINIFGGHFFTTTALCAATGDIVKVQNTLVPTLNIAGASQRLYANILNDTVNTRTVAVQGNYIAGFEYYGGFALLRERGASLQNIFTSGSQNAVGLRNFGDGAARTILRGNGAIVAETISASTGFTGPLTGNASTATALAADPTPCGANLFVTDQNASGGLTCTQPAFTNLSGTATKAQQHAATVYNDAANTWSTGIQDFSAATALRIKTGSGVPAGTACDAAGEVGSIYIRNDANATNSSFYVCSQTAVTPTFGWELAQGAGGGGAVASGHYLTTVADANTNEVVVTPGEGTERRINETDSNGGPYTLDFDPNDSSYFWIREEFCGGLTTTGNVGDNGWNLITIVAAPTVTYQATAFPNPCVARLSTGAASGNGGTMSPGLINPLGNMGGTTNWDVTYVFRLQGTVTESFRIGLVAAMNAIEPTGGIWLRYDTNLADAAFKVETRSASTSTVGGTTYTVDTNFHKIRMRSTTAGTVVFTFDANADQSIATNVPTVSLAPGIVLATRAAAARTVDVDFFALKIRGLAR